MLSVLSISMGAMLGSGIFVLPGLAVSIGKEALPLAYLLSALIVLPAALCKCELATALPRAGGTYLYVDRSLGPLAGTVVGLGTWFSLLFKSAFALVGLGAYLAWLFDLSPAALNGISAGLCLALVVLNVVGVKKAGKAQTVVVAISLSALLLFVLLSLPHLEAERLTRLGQPPPFDVLACAGMVFVSFAGVTKVCSIAEEVQQPERNLPRGILASLALVTVIYVAVSLVLVGAVELNVFEGRETPLADAARSHLGPLAGAGMAVVAVLTLTSMANAGLMTSSRYPLAMARDRLLPGLFERISPRFRTPIPGILLTGALMLGLIALVDVRSLAKLASAFQLLVFSLVNLTVIFIRESGARWYKPGFSVPGYPFVPLLGFLGSASLLAFMGPLAIGGAVGITAFGLAWYALYARRRVTRWGAVTRLYGERARVSGRLSHLRVSTQPAGVIVPVLGGHDEDLETRLPLAGALADEAHDQLLVLRIEEIPDLRALADFTEDDPQTARIAEHAEQVATASGLTCTFEDVLTHHTKHVLYERALADGIDWIVMRWQPRSPWRVFVPDPVAWFVHHPPCNLALYREDGRAGGIERFRRILVLAEAGPHDVSVVHAADRVARAAHGALTFVHLVPPDASEEVRAGGVDYHEHLRKLCSSPVAPPRIVSTGDELSTLQELSAEFDLLVLGAPPAAEVRGALRGSFEDRVTEQAACAVLRVKATGARPHPSLRRSRGAGRLGTSTDALRLERDPAFLLGAFLDHVELSRAPLRTKAELFQALGRGFQERLAEPLERRVEDALWERERLQVTALAQGVAIPHHTGLHGLSRIHVEVWLLERPVDFKGGHDVDPVDICFLVLGPPSERETHLRVLARIARLALHPGFLQGLRDAADARAARELIEEGERALARIDALDSREEEPAAAGEPRDEAEGGAE
ncbi:MAG: amino acid permease [Planctomycetota bacterium]